MSWSDLLCPARADIDLSKIQRRLERKLAESAAATSQLRLRTRENRDLETQNMRLRHRQVLRSRGRGLFRGLLASAILCQKD